MTNVPGPLVTIVGGGGVGTPALWALIEKRVFGTPLQIRIIDHDLVARSNLNRQVLFTEWDIGKPKAEQLLPALSRLLPERSFGAGLKIIPFVERLDAGNISRLLGESAAVIDATDCVATKLLINDYCVGHGITHCYVGAVGYSAQLLLAERASHLSDPTAAATLGASGCLRCLFDQYSDDDFANQHTSCQQAGILGGVAGIIGFLSGGLVSRLLNQEPLRLQDVVATTSDTGTSQVYRYSPRDYSFTSAQVRPSQDCPLGCGRGHLAALDLREKSCPTTLLYSKMAMEQLPPDMQALAILLGNEGSARNVASSCEELGYQLVSKPREIANSEWRIVLGRVDL